MARRMNIEFQDLPAYEKSVLTDHLVMRLDRSEIRAKIRKQKKQLTNITKYIETKKTKLNDTAGAYYAVQCRARSIRKKRRVVEPVLESSDSGSDISGDSGCDVELELDTLLENETAEPELDPPSSAEDKDSVNDGVNPEYSCVEIKKNTCVSSESSSMTMTRISSHPPEMTVGEPSSSSSGRSGGPSLSESSYVASSEKKRRMP